MPAWILCFLLSAMVLACGSKKRVEPPAPAPLATVPYPSGSNPQSGNMALDGKGLYDHYCAACHGGLEQSSAARANAAAIHTAMMNIPEMQGLPELQDEQVNSLATALSKIPPGKAKGKAEANAPR